jgi:hypothetical protein
MTGRPSQIPLPPDARAAFDRLLRMHSRQVVARMLGASIWTVESLACNGRAQPVTVARVTDAVRRATSR